MAVTSVDIVSMRNELEALYDEYNKREYVSPDPLEFLYKYGGDDVEVVGLIASSLAYGRVASILSSTSAVLDVLGTWPAQALRRTPLEDLEARLHGFRHRFVKGPEVAKFLYGIGRTLEDHGSLGDHFASLMPPGGGRVGLISAMDSFAKSVVEAGGLESSHLLPRASKGSACKRMALYLRWMVRRDCVDPGCWSCVDARDLIIPLDTHMFKISSALGFTSRKSANGKAVLETTEGFAAICPEDPTKYDFALTRFGIRNEMSEDSLLSRILGASDVEDRR